MAVLIARAMMEAHDEMKSVHPFFGKRTKSQDIASETNSIALVNNVPSGDSATLATERKGRVRPAGCKAGKPSPDKPAKNSVKTKRQSRETTSEESAQFLEVDLNLSRRKRQKSESPGDESVRNDGFGSGKKNNPGVGEGYNAQSDATVISTGDFDGCGLGALGPHQPSNPSTSSDLDYSSIPSSFIGVATVNSPSVPIKPSLMPKRSPTDVEAVTSDSSVITPRPNMTKPQKTLRLNAKTGTIGSPPAKKQSRLSNGTATGKKSGRDSAQSQSAIVTITYGHDRHARSTTGQNIDEILSGVKSFPSLQKLPRESKVSVQARPSKSTHPFFLGKSAPKMLASGYAEQTTGELAKEGKSTRLKSSMTLGEAKSHSPAKRPTQASGHGAFQHFGNTTKILRFPGATDACWPPKEMIHVRCSTQSASPSIETTRVAALSTQRKSKYTAAETLARDDIIKILATDLNIGSVLKRLKRANSDDFAEPARSLRVPTKHFENGFQIQRRVRRELAVKLPLNATSVQLSDSENEIQRDGKANAQINTALLRIYKSLPSSLTAFDQSQYETQSWIHKYSPSAAAEVLQCGKDAFILKEWLQSLTIIAVDAGTSDHARSRASSVASRRSALPNAEKPGNKRRKANKLEGFVISSEEEGDDMDEISDPEENSEETHRLTKRTVIRSGGAFNRSSRDSQKLKNAVVISGPSGCGKTAMVYAVAKELGFEIFEINSSSRRSGKEILERVGDMTRNHLVHRSDQLGPPDPQDEDIQHISAALSADLNSGRQGTMNSFFKPKKGVIPGVKHTTSSGAKKDAGNEAAKSTKATTKQQKQSLILLEEVDILFGEDKQFWATVMNLIAQSKRPIIMTCNDETILPLHSLELHAIIRLSSPPPDIAIDYMLMVAAAEGHVVKRKAVKVLYEARQFDLRAALTELDYWCQIGVGDMKGGLDWFYPRWPPGCDVDGDGHKIRVVSEGTYKTGMGWLGRDNIFERLDEPDIKEQVLRDVWDGWNIDIGDWYESLEIASLLEDATKDSRLSSLISYEAFAESMSSADICACSNFATGNQIPLDTCAPPVTAKARDDFIIGYELLQADTMVSYNTLNKELPNWIKSRARQLLQAHSHSRCEALSEAQVSAKIAALCCRKDDSICRHDFSIAFDPIAEPERSTVQYTPSLEPSVFDRTTRTIAVDVAPYVRSIVAYDAKLQHERARLSNLLSEGGRKGKRLRTTRSALSALEGGARKTTRPEKYFRVPINPHLVCRTGLQSWQDALSAEMSEAEAVEMPSAFYRLEGSSPGMTDSS